MLKFTLGENIGDLGNLPLMMDYSLKENGNQGLCGLHQNNVLAMS
jgi:hypothetical protein